MFISKEMSLLFNRNNLTKEIILFDLMIFIFRFNWYYLEFLNIFFHIYIYFI